MSRHKAFFFTATAIRKQTKKLEALGIVKILPGELRDKKRERAKIVWRGRK